MVDMLQYAVRDKQTYESIDKRIVEGESLRSSISKAKNINSGALTVLD